LVKFQKKIILLEIIAAFENKLVLNLREPTLRKPIEYFFENFDTLADHFLWRLFLKTNSIFKMLCESQN
jgi:hypothetical protein